MSTMKDRDGVPLEPGALYAALVEGDELSAPASVVAYLYWTGVELVHDDGEHDTFTGDADYLVRQAAAPINASMIDEPFFDAIAEGIAEYRTTGGDL